jgi:hypothetical protein
MPAKKKKKEKGGGLGLAATLVGAAAAGYYLYGPKGKENRVKLKAWTLKAKGEVLEKFEKAKEVSDESYAETVDKVTAKYAKLKSVGEDEAMKLNRELKRHWKAIKKAAEEKQTRPKK